MIFDDSQNNSEIRGQYYFAQLELTVRVGTAGEVMKALELIARKERAASLNIMFAAGFVGVREQDILC
jgi:hypothetical protein